LNERLGFLLYWNFAATNILIYAREFGWRHSLCTLTHGNKCCMIQDTNRTIWNSYWTIWIVWCIVSVSELCLNHTIQVWIVWIAIRFVIRFCSSLVRAHFCAPVIWVRNLSSRLHCSGCAVVHRWSHSGVTVIAWW